MINVFAKKKMQYEKLSVHCHAVLLNNIPWLVFTTFRWIFFLNCVNFLPDYLEPMSVLKTQLITDPNFLSATMMK